MLIGIIGASGAILLFKHAEPKTDAQVMPRAARLERMDGNVDVAQALNQANNDQLNWTDATVNAPLTVGQRIFARENSHAEIAFTGRNYARLNPGTALDVLSLADRRTQLALRNGSAIFDVGNLTDGELYEVATPCGAVDFMQPGLYQLGIGDDGNTTISVLSGLAQVVGLAGSLTPRQQMRVRVRRENGEQFSFNAIARVDSPVDVDYLKHGGVLPFVLRTLLKPEPAAR